MSLHLRDVNDIQSLLSDDFITYVKYTVGENALYKYCSVLPLF